MSIATTRAVIVDALVVDEADVKALARFSVIALGVLPFLPNAQYGPYGAWNPSLLFVMGGAAVTFGLFYAVTMRRRSP